MQGWRESDGRFEHSPACQPLQQCVGESGTSFESVISESLSRPLQK